jgi:hypothetical protein
MLYAISDNILFTFMLSFRLNQYLFFSSFHSDTHFTYMYPTLSVKGISLLVFITDRFSSLSFFPFQSRFICFHWVISLRHRYSFYSTKIGARRTVNTSIYSSYISATLFHLWLLTILNSLLLPHDEVCHQRQTIEV